MYFKKLLLLGVTVLASICLYSQNNMNVIAHFEGEHHNSKFGHSMVSLDFNHDGYDDLAVCSFAYGYIYGQVPARGKVYIYYGGPNFSSNTPASVNMEGTYANSTGRRIWAIYKVGDISGDGFDDLCVYVEDYISSMEYNEKLLFFYGGMNSLETPEYEIILTGAIYMFHSVSKLGDLNGDGHGDMGIVYTRAAEIPYQKCLSILWGGNYEEQVVSWGEAGSGYTISINGIGDINHDSYQDFTTGFATPSQYPSSNLMRLYYGNPLGITDDPITFFQTTSGLNRASKQLGDIINDGYDDFMGYVSNDGMHVWLGGSNINYAIPDFSLEPAWFGGETTRSLEYGDFNNDGFDDIVGASYGERQLSVWLGKQHVNGDSDWITGQNNEYYGYSLVTGDFNADSYCDIAIAAPFEYDPLPTGDVYGFIWVYGGNAELADTTVANDDPSIPEVSEQMQVHVSPNPVLRSDSSIRVKIDYPKLLRTSNATIEIYNIKGQRVASQDIILTSGTMNFDVNFPNLSNGVYLCRVQAGEHSASVKISIVK